MKSHGIFSAMCILDIIFWLIHWLKTFQQLGKNFLLRAVTRMVKFYRILLFQQRHCLPGKLGHPLQPPPWLPFAHSALTKLLFWALLVFVKPYFSCSSRSCTLDVIFRLFLRLETHFNADGQNFPFYQPVGWPIVLFLPRHCRHPEHHATGKLGYPGHPDKAGHPGHLFPTWCLQSYCFASGWSLENQVLLFLAHSIYQNE